MEDFNQIYKNVQQIPNFSGGRNKKGIEELKLFIRSAEGLFNSIKTPEGKTIFLDLIINRLRGDAFSIINNFKYDSLNDLITDLRKHFTPIKSPTDVVSEIGEAKQLPTESVLEFGTRLQELVSTAKDLYKSKYPDKDTSLLETEAENQAIKSLKKGMFNGTFKAALLTYKSDSLRDLVDVATTLEESYSDTKNSKTSVFKISEYDALQVQMKVINEKLEKLNFKENPVMFTQSVHNPLRCDFCNNMGHTRDHCKKLYNSFCTNCRTYGHPVYECNINYVENRYRNPSSANNRNYNNYNQPMENYDNFRNKQSNQPNKYNTQYTNNNEPS